MSGSVKIFSSSQNGEIEGYSGQQKLATSSYDEAVSATMLCKSFAQRLEMYKVAADAGHARGRLR